MFEIAEACQRITQAAVNLGLTLQEFGNPKTAGKQLRQTIEFSKQLGSLRQGIPARIALADLMLERHEASEAERFAQEALALFPSNKQGNIDSETLYGRVLVTKVCFSRLGNHTCSLPRYRVIDVMSAAAPAHAG